jgi:hypothetical protein
VWNEYAPSHVQISLPTAIIDAMFLAGFPQTTDRKGCNGKLTIRLP